MTEHMKQTETLFAVIMTSNPELEAIRLFRCETDADVLFESWCERHKLQHCDFDLNNEVVGTLRVAGDETHAAQVIQLTISARPPKRAHRLAFYLASCLDELSTWQKAVLVLCLSAGLIKGLLTAIFS